MNERIRSRLAKIQAARDAMDDTSRTIAEKLSEGVPAEAMALIGRELIKKAILCGQQEDAKSAAEELDLLCADIIDSIEAATAARESRRN